MEHQQNPSVQRPTLARPRTQVTCIVFKDQLQRLDAHAYADSESNRSLVLRKVLDLGLAEYLKTIGDTPAASCEGS